jgi:hypothetical protein
MAKMQGRHGARLSVERLEQREMPSTSPWMVEQFDQTTLGSLPDGWSSHSSDGHASFVASEAQALGSGSSLRTDGNSRSETRVWANVVLPADAQVSANIFLNSLVPGQVLARGQDLDSDKPSYYSVAVTRGMQIQLLKVIDGESTVLATLKSATWVSNKWARVTLSTIGDDLYVQVFRTDTAQYLNSDGRWQYSATQAIHVQDDELSAGGNAGLARSAQYAGAVHFDNFVTAPPGDLGQQSQAEEKFTRPVSGGLPSGWVQWGENGARLQVSTAKTLTDTGALRTVTAGPGAVRSWLNTNLPADVDVSATLFVSNSAPAQVFARGRNLTTGTPTYYALSVTEGMQLQLLRVVNGESTVLATLASQESLTDKWVRVTLSLSGDELQVGAYRVDTAQYLNADGNWQVMPAWAMDLHDAAIAGEGKAGVGRGPGAAGVITFDSFSATTAIAGPATENTTGGSFNFDGNAVGSMPPGWSNWDSSDSGSFQVTDELASSGKNSLMSDGGSDLESRAWLTTLQAADAQIGGSVYLDSLVPAQLILRGRNLDTSSPSYYAASVTRGLDVQLIRVVNGQTTVLSTLSSGTWDSNLWVRLNFTIQGDTLQLQVIRLDNGKYLNQDGDWQDDPDIAISVSDTALDQSGYAGLVRPASYSGRVLFDDVAIDPLPASAPIDSPPIQDPPVTTPPDSVPPDGSGSLPEESPPSAGSEPPPVEPPTSTPPVTQPSALPDVPQHMDHIRIAEFAYYGTPIASLEQKLLKNNIDLVVANINLVNTIEGVSPSTPQFIYTNASNIYRELLTDWLNYADAHGLNREAAFYHVTQATPFTGDSASSWPVRWFWNVAMGSDGNWMDKTSYSHDPTQPLTFGGAGQSLMLGNTERFREINFDFVQGADSGWRGVLEYASAVDANGKATAWKKLDTVSDGTAGFTRSGRITFDPPPDWVPNQNGDGTPLYYVRIRTITDGDAPISRTILGRDYVNANGRAAGTIPVFDKSADSDGDGYLSDAEYAMRHPGMDARFVYEARAFYPAYGQNRFATNVANPAFQQWAADFSYRFLQANPGAGGLFVDNSLSKIAFDPRAIAESLDNYADNYAQVLAAINARIAPEWVVANVAGGGTAVDALAKRGISYLEEFAIRPLAASYSQFEDVSANLKRRLGLSKGKSYAILDSLATNGSMTDARVQIATLAYYYLLADPTQTMLMFNGGNAPNTTWSQHWAPAAQYDVGQPKAGWTVFAQGQDPANTTMTYKVYQRQYDNALVLYKPLSYYRGKAGATGDSTATTHILNGKYRPLLPDGQLGAVISRITLRNGEGAILVKV